jgi:hypothetical protein
MKSWLRDLWQAALLKSAALERLSLDGDAFLRGFLLIIAVALIAGAPRAVLGLVQNLQPGRESVELQTGVRTGFDSARPWLERAGVPAPVIEQIFEQGLQGATLGADLGEQMNRLPTALPRPLAHAARSLGTWLSGPFSGPRPLPLSAAVLATWLGYGLWVMLFSKLLGGQADLGSFFGATATFAIPHVLGAFALVPVAGPWLGVIAFVWGILIYVKATAVSHGFSTERGLLATVLPFLLLVAVLLVLLAVVALFALLAMAR